MDFLRIKLNLKHNLNESEREMFMKNLVLESRYRFVIITALHTLITIIIVASIILAIVIATKHAVQNYIAIERSIRDFFRPFRYLRYDSETLWRTRTRTAISMMNTTIWNSNLAWRFRTVSRIAWLSKKIVHKIKVRNIRWMFKKLKWKTMMKMVKAMMIVNKYLPGIFKTVILILLINIVIAMIMIIIMILFTLWMKHGSHSHSHTHHEYVDDDE